MTLDQALDNCPIVAILRGVRPDEVVDHVLALQEAGVCAVEVPLNSPAPLESLARLVDRFGEAMALGSGTVLTAEDVDGVAAAGGHFLVAPNLNLDVVRRALARGVTPAPGCFSPSEVLAAWSAGARQVKLFPAASLGPDYLKQLRAALPQDLDVWAVGGIRLSDIGAWRTAGARAYGIGGELFRPGQSPDQTRASAAAFVEAAKTPA